ncbi:MAG: C-GCAxxG-C-C family protein [Ignavibacteria bacterium]|nr:C-GCAxxG-C-C family protein [Ignavibacteria bacterium]
MNSREEKAKVIFDSGRNCAQSVLSAFSADLNFDAGSALKISSAFGGGMGRLQEKCGAVTGAFMVLGIYCSDKYTDEKERKNNINSLVQQFNKRFTDLHGSSVCRQLMNCDLNTEEGRKYSEENKLKDNVCAKCVRSSVRIIEEMIDVKSEQ